MAPSVYEIAHRRLKSWIQVRSSDSFKPHTG
jgi:hypothetical protein